MAFLLLLAFFSPVLLLTARAVWGPVRRSR